MANLTPTATFDSVVQLETTTVALGGAGAPMNLQAQALLNRTQYLYVQISNLATVATTGDYNSLINRPALGSAAFQNSAAFATAAQGAKADGAAQVSSLSTVAFSGAYADLVGKPFASDAPSDGNQYARKNGAWVVVSGGSGGFTNPMTSVGDLIVGGVGGVPTRFPVGTPGQQLTPQAGGTLAWQTPSTATTLSSVGGFIDPTKNDLELIIRRSHTVTALGVGFIGDSITAGTTITTPPTTPCATSLSIGAVTTTATNQGHSGATTVDWLPGASSGYLAAAKTAFSSAGVRLVHIMLGTNDSKTQPNGTGTSATTHAQYRANLLSICDDLIASGYLVSVSYPPFLNTTASPFDASSPGLVASYCTAIDQLIDNKSIFRGDAQGYAYFQANTSALQGDGVHPTQAGSDHLAQLWATALLGQVNGLTNTVVYDRAVLRGNLTASGSNPVYIDASAGSSGQLAGINDQTGTTYTLVLSDAGKDVRCTNSSGVNITIPPNSSVTFPIGAWLLFSQGGTGVVTAVAGSGVTLRAANGAATTAQYDIRGLEKIGTDEWRVI